MTEPRYADAAELATWIRADLKTAFAWVKFSVRISRYSMGSSVSIAWTDGPTTEQVDRVVKGYQGISFDGSDDSTHYRAVKSPTGELVHAGSYVTTSRRLTPAAESRVRARMTATETDAADYWPVASRACFSPDGAMVFVTTNVVIIRRPPS
jgi:hypothetical protein